MSPAVPSSPYKGLTAFEDSELDALLFFGREREREIVVANLAASPLTVLYGPSGVGKSSLLRAAVARSLRQLPEAPLVIVFSRWSDDPGAALAEAVLEASGGDEAGSALEALEHAQSGRDVYLILDQAEEYFLYHGGDDGPGSFADTLPAILAGRYRVNVLISLREDSLAKLDRFTGRIPGLFANTLRLDRLDREAAHAAIVRPVERFAELTRRDVAVEPELVERVLDDVGAGQIEPALGGLGAVATASDGDRIEAPYLQLVMQRLWDEERAAGSDVLRVETLDRLGGARRIVEEHLAGAIAVLSPGQKDVAARLFNHLVTPSGTKIAHDLSDLADFGEVPVDELQPVLATLAERRILRSVEEAGGVRYEIFHDVLAQPVLAWRARHRAERELERRLADAQRRRRRLQWLFVIVLAALGLVSALGLYALSQRNDARTRAEEARTRAREADERTRQAKALKLDAFAIGARATDPELGLLLAREAVRVARTSTSEKTLREALESSRIRRVIHLRQPVLRAVVRRRVVAATTAGTVVTADARTGRVRKRIDTGVRALAASLSAGGVALLTGADGRPRLVRPGGSVTRPPGIAFVRGAELSRDGKRALVFNQFGARLVEIESGRVLQTFPRTDTLAATISRDGELVATGHAAKTVRVWKALTGERILKLFTHVGDIVAVAISPDGKRVASANTKGIAQVWQIADGKTIAVLGGHAAGLTDVAFNPSGRLLVTASRDRTVRVSDVDASTTVAVLRGHTGTVTAATFTGTGLVVSTSVDRTVRMWDARPESQLKVNGTLDELMALADRRLAATGRNLTAAERKRFLG